MKRISIRLISLFTWACLCLIASVVNVAAQNLFFEQVSSRSDSPNTSIYGIAKDSLGYVWFGSWNGLYRYDGVDFEVFKHEPEEAFSLPNNRLRNIITDDNKQLWILTFDSKYVKYSYAKNNFSVVPDSLVSNNVKLLLRYRSNELNRQTLINGNRFVIQKNKLSSFHRNPDSTTTYTPSVWQPGRLTDDNISYFFIDDQKIIWVGSRNGNVFKANTVRSPFNLHHVYGKKSASSVSASIRTITKKQNQLWLGSNTKGIFIYDNEKELVDNPFYRCERLDNDIRELYLDNSGDIWIGSVEGLERYNTTTGKTDVVVKHPLHPELLRTSVYSMVESKNNWMWFGLYQELARVNTKTLEVKVYNLRKSLGDCIIMQLLEDRDGNIWIATEGNGIFRFTFDTDFNITHTFRINNFAIATNNIFIGNYVYALYQDQQGTIWVGTSEGLNYINPSTLEVKQLNHIDGLQDDYISAITSDRGGNLWVSTKKGLSKIEKKSRRISNFIVGENNINWVFLDGACFNDTVNNSIYFGAREGYVSFDPDEIQPASFAPQLLLTSLYLGGVHVAPNKEINSKVILSKALCLTDSIELTYNNRNFSLDLTALHYPNPRGITYSYTLVGYDDDWIETSYNNVSYAKVPAGKYLFRATALSLDGNRSNEVQLIISVLSPWNATPFAITLYILFTIVMLVLIQREILSRARLKNQVLLERMNVEKQEELNRAKMDFFTNVSHELRTPLTLIVDPIKQLQNRFITAENRELYLEIINRNVGQLHQLINQLLDFRKAEAGKLKQNLTVVDAIEILETCIESFYMNALQRHIHLNFRSETPQIIGQFDKSKMEQIFLNLISNAFKYTQNGGVVTVLCKLNNNAQKIVVTIEDNGVGIDTNSLKTIFEPFNTVGTKPFHGNSSGMGLALTNNLVKILNGDIKVTSTINVGTTVQVSLPLGKQNNIPQTDNKPTKQQIDNTSNIISASNLSHSDTSKPMLLIVEDNSDVQSYLKAELANDYIIHSELNGIDGLKNAILNIPDLIISDVMMPLMDGVTLCKEIKKNEKTSHIPLIMLTAKSSPENQIEGLKTGADVYLSKPFNVEVLKAQLISILENRRRLQETLSKKEHITEIKDDVSNVDNDFLLKVVELITANISVIGFHSESLSEQLGMNQRQLYRKLKAISGNTVQEFISRVRMDEASKLLLNSSMNISQIAYAVGFSELSNFSRAFTKYYGCSPSEYIKKKQG